MTERPAGAQTHRMVAPPWSAEPVTLKNLTVKLRVNAMHKYFYKVRVTRVAASLILIMPVIAATTFAEEQKKQPGMWVVADPEPTPTPVRQAIDALKAITVADLQKMEDYDLARLKDMSRTTVELVSVEEKRRREGGRR